MRISDFSRYALCVCAGVAVPAGCGGAGSSGSPAGPTQGLAGIGRPFAIGAVRERPLGLTRPSYSTKGSLVFEADLGQEDVNIYRTSDLSKNPAPIATLHTKTGCPDGLAADKKGTLYVSDECNGNDVEEFPKGSTIEKTIITDGTDSPSGLAIDKKGTLYVSLYPAAIVEYAYGTTTPSQTITGQGLKDPFGLALDKSDNLYIADFGADQVFEVMYGSTTVTALNLKDLTEPLGVAIDQKTGYLWVTDGRGNKTNVYELGTTSPVEERGRTEFRVNVPALPRKRGSEIGAA
jgi:DNA-binding beta-propeller fold protein YncE